MPSSKKSTATARQIMHLAGHDSDSENAECESAALMPNRPHITMQLPHLLARTGSSVPTDAVDVKLSNMLDSAIARLSAAEVGELLIARVGIPEEVADVFVEEGIDSKALLLLNEEDLKILGVGLVGQRKRILRMVRFLAADCAQPATLGSTESRHSSECLKL
eukprot:TRINITY_DN16022_c0_g1_i1.p1 TRINITY_DN16022_c0_g1~~TRINITY_DN16022_c0_g1_i1.p1  ORF type:complete len:163 (+),score=32.84 TRINITY_DN16022_c0_g1_i1:48-536(+)